MNKAITICAVGAILVGAAMAQEPVPVSVASSSKTVAPQKAPGMELGKAKTPAPIKMDCCADGAMTKKSAKFKVYVANKGYQFYGCEKDAHAGRKTYTAQGIRVGPIQKVSQAIRSPKAVKA